MVLAKQQTIKLIQKLKNKYILQLYPVGAAHFPKQTLLEYGKFLQSGAWYRVEEDHGKLLKKKKSKMLTTKAVVDATASLMFILVKAVDSA